MPYTDNKCCKNCTMFEGTNWDSCIKFIKKYGEYGCSGIPSASGEFPYNAPAHCFTEKPLKTKKQRKKIKIKNVKKIIKTYKSSEAAEYIVDRWDSI